jgi:dTDP-4-amino-4,6-dideoxygalactose transaminase
MKRDALFSMTEKQGPQRYWATELPLLRPRMLLGRSRTDSAFPFNDSRVQYVHFARNAIYALAQQLNLAGADVLMPAYFHGVEVEALLAAGAKPRFFPVRAGMHVEPDDIRKLLRHDTRAIYLIHYLGFPGPIEAVRELCNERGLLLIEDCALALLSRSRGQWLGSIGDASVFCLYKTLPTPDGGAVVVKRERLCLDGVPPHSMGTARETAAALLLGLESSPGKSVSALARATRAIARTLARPTESNWVHVGTQHFVPDDARLLMSNVSRRILAAQNFDAIVAARRRNYAHLQSLLHGLAPPVFDGLPDGVCPLFYPFATRHKRELWTCLRSQGIQAVLFWMTTDLGPRTGEFADVDQLRQTILELPCHQDMTPEKIAKVAHIVRASLRQLAA